MKLNYYIAEKLLYEEVFIPCPGCGEMKNLVMHKKVISYAKNEYKFYVGCNRCGWEGPEANKAKQSANLWDVRVPIYK